MMNYYQPSQMKSTQIDFYELPLNKLSMSLMNPWTLDCNLQMSASANTHIQSCTNTISSQQVQSCFDETYCNLLWGGQQTQEQAFMNYLQTGYQNAYSQEMQMPMRNNHYDVNSNLKDCMNNDVSLQEKDFFFNKPKNFKVKEAKKAELSEYKYSVCYKFNEESWRNLRYYICEYDNCGRLFNKTWNFIDHVRIHTGDKPFRCEVCNRGFAQKGNLNKHKRLHKDSN